MVIKVDRLDVAGLVPRKDTLCDEVTKDVVRVLVVLRVLLESLVLGRHFFRSGELLLDLDLPILCRFLLVLDLLLGSSSFSARLQHLMTYTLGY